MRQQMKWSGLWTAVAGLDPNADILGIRLRVLDEHIEVPVVVKDSGVEQFELRGSHLSPTPPTLFYELPVGKLSLRILVENFLITVGRGVVEVKPVFLHVLPVIAFIAGKTEHPLFQNR